MGLLSNFAQGALGYGVKYLEQEQEREDKMADAQKLAEFKAQIDAKAEMLKDALKAQREEANAQRDARTKIAADDLGAKNLEDAQFQKFKKDLGQSDASDEELRKVFSDQYFDRSVAPGDANSQRYDPRDSDFIRAGRDAALKTGASSGLIKQFGEDLKLQQTAEQKAIEEARKERDTERRHQETMIGLGIKQQNADTNSQRLEIALARIGEGKTLSPTEVKSMTSLDIERATNAAKDRIALELGVPTTEINAKIKSLSNAAAKGDKTAKDAMSTLEPLIKNLKDLQGRQTDLNRNNPVQQGNGGGDQAGGQGGVYVPPGATSKPGGTGKVGNDMSTGAAGDIAAQKRAIAEAEAAPTNKTFTQAMKDDQLFILRDELAKLEARAGGTKTARNTDTQKTKDFSRLWN